MAAAFLATPCCIPVGNDATWRYETDIECSNITLETLLEATLQKPLKELHGLLDGTAQIQGYIGLGTGPRVTGQGTATVRKGFLFQTKLFSGLSAILSKIIPDFSLFAQTDATGSYSIRNSKVHSDDIELKGTVFSVKASGDYAFDTSLDYRVEVQLLRWRPAGGGAAPGHPARHPPAGIPPNGHLPGSPLAPLEPQSRRTFQGLEHPGFSMVWKPFSRIFHGMEKMFPHYGKIQTRH